MTTIAAIVDALLEQVGTIDNLNTGTVLAANMPTPVAIVSPPGQGTYRGTFGATGYLGGESWTVTVLVSASLVEDGMRVLHAAADVDGDWSIYAAISADPTLGGIVDQAVVQGWRFLSFEEVDALGHFGVEITVAIAARKG